MELVVSTWRVRIAQLVFMFLTRATLTIISLQYQDSAIEGILDISTLGVCNTSCDFIWNSELLSGNCSTYKKLTTLVQGRQQLCHNENLTISVSIRSEMNMVISVDNFDFTPFVSNVEFIDCRGKFRYTKSCANIISL